MRREKHKRRKPRGEITEARDWDGLTCTSGEGSVMGLERRGRSGGRLAAMHELIQVLNAMLEADGLPGPPCLAGPELAKTGRALVSRPAGFHRQPLADPSRALSEASCPSLCNTSLCPRRAPVHCSGYGPVSDGRRDPSSLLASGDLGPSVYRAHSDLCTVIRRYKGPEVEIRTLGIDLAKNVFRVHGVDARGKTTVQRRLRRRQVRASCAPT